MNDKNKLRAKIQLIILSVILTVFAITGIIYAVTLKQYIFNDKPNTIVAEEKKAETAQGEKAPDKTEKPDTETISEEKYPVTHEKEPAEKPVEEVIEKDEEPTFRELNETRYADEIAAAYKTYLSDTTYIAVMKEEIDGSPYCLAHIVLDDPRQLRTIVMPERKYASKLYETYDILLAMNASTLNEGYADFIDGLHICDYNVISDTTMTVGNELAFNNTGYLSILEKDIPFEKIKPNSIQWTVLSVHPWLIADGKALEIPDDTPSETTCKSVIGMVTPGEYYFMVVSDGDYMNDITYADMQKILLDKSCTFAHALSTGVNSVMSMQGELINQPAVGPGRPQFEYIIVSDTYKEE